MVYCVAKAAVNNPTHCLTADYSDRGVRANADCPSATQTEMFLTSTTQPVMDAFNRQYPVSRIDSLA